MRYGVVRPFQVKPTHPDHSTRNGEARTVLGKLGGLWRPFKYSLKERMTVSYRISAHAPMRMSSPEQTDRNIGRRCLTTRTREAQAERDCAGAGAGIAAPVSGLVPSKTSPLEILFDKAVTRKKRVKRLRRSVWAAGHLHGLADHGRRPPVAWMVTLTYVGVDDWRADHISAASEQYRRHCARLRVPCRYLWVAELQKRGAVHYHLIAWLPKGVRMPHWDRETVSLRVGLLGPSGAME